MRIRFSTAAGFAAILVVTQAVPPAARAQSSPGYFIPPTAAPPATPRSSSSRVRPARTVPVQSAPLPEPEPAPDSEQAQQQAPMPPLPQPPVPTLPALPKGAPPPTAVIGVLGVPDVMRQSNAAQIIQRVIGARKEKLRVDVDRAQATWRELEQSLQADAPKLSPEQGRARERALRERVNNDRHALQERNRIIAEAGQVALNQIESTLVAVIRQVAESRGMNVVLHRSQVALNMPEFDITAEVTQQLNKLMPTVQIPAENVDPATLPKDYGTPAALPVSATPAASTH
jgi:Skp family chaperone for outer membrane proteins